MTFEPIVEPGILEDGIAQQITAEMRQLQSALAALDRQLAEAKAQAVVAQAVVDQTKAQLAEARRRLNSAMEA